MKKWIPFLELANLHQSISSDLQDKLKEVINNGIFSGGKEVGLFETKVKEFLKLPAAISCSNGTDALVLALKALGIGHGDAVIVPALSWISTAEAVVNTGAIPVFCDVDEDGLISLDEAEKLISPQVKCVIPVHLYGKMVNMPGLMDFTERHKVKVVEDAAQAFGAFQ